MATTRSTTAPAERRPRTSARAAQKERIEAAVTRLTGYATPDGARFDTRKEAADHIAMCEFQAYIDGTAPMVNDVGVEAQTVHSVVVATWIQRNRAAVLDYLRATRPGRA